MALAHRHRIVLIGLLVLGLDLARSGAARFARATPVPARQEGGAPTAAAAEPPATTLAGTAPLGARIYAQHCATCHGPHGRGDGPAAPPLQPRPRDFSGGVFKVKSTAGAAPPTLADVRAAIAAGLPGASMAGFGGILSPAEIDAVAEHVRGLGPHAAWAPSPTRPPLDPVLSAVASPERGREVYVALGCPACHGGAGRGDGTAAAALKDVWGQPDPPRDLTAPWTFRGGSDPQAVAARIAFGMSGTPMPAYAGELREDQLADLVAYVRSIARPQP